MDYVSCMLQTKTKNIILHVTFIEQKGECIIIYFGRPCDESGLSKYLMVHE
jgi:hypothetical protein